jgi:hypothetical protein
MVELLLAAGEAVVSVVAAGVVDWSVVLVVEVEVAELGCVLWSVVVDGVMVELLLVVELLLFAPVVSGFVVASGSLLSPPVVPDVAELEGVPGVAFAGAALLF